MCGIFGALSSNKIDLKVFNDALISIKHRGPDFDRSELLSDYVAFGHVRLSILDLSPESHQPFSVDDRYSLTYNGEIYNYLEIKQELISLGIQFKTKGDTEVLLRAFIKWGDKCVNKFNGMWAFAIYDKVEDRLFCSRDRFGVKPFCYSQNENELLFSSEIKAIINYNPQLKEPNYNMIANFCYKSLGAQSEQTWFKNVFRLLPAHNLIFEKGKISIHKYWEYPTKVDLNITFEKAKENFEALFIDAVKIRMRSDVEVGSTLTSGLDSSSIVGILKHLGYENTNTYTAFSNSDDFGISDKIAYKKDIDLDESKIVEKLNKDFNTKPNMIKVSFSDFIEKLYTTIYHLESGHSSPATIPIHQVYKKANEKIKVLMEGQGADELLAGYVSDIAPFHIINLIKKGKIKSAVKEFNIYKSNYSVKYLFLLFFRSFDSGPLNFIKNKLLGIRIFNEKKYTFKYLNDTPFKLKNFDDTINKMLCYHHRGKLVNLLHYGDALSMSHGIESRLPFMDYRLVEYSFKLPYHYKFNYMKGKLIQRQALGKYLPNYITESLIKIGFATPIDQIINTSKEAENILINYNYNSFFDNTNISKMLERNKKGKKAFSPILFRILSAKIWFKIFIDQNEPEIKGFI